MIRKIKERIPLDIKMRCNAFLNTACRKKWMQNKDCERMRIYIFLAAFYQNLGDMAITFAQRDFLSKLYPDAEIILVPDNETYSAVSAIKKNIRNTDLVTVIGGGNMSDSYIHLETSRRHVVKNFPNNRIILFPQTMFFGNDKNGRRELKHSRKVYEGHNNLTMFAREPLSLERMKNEFPKVDARLAPDIVLSLKQNNQECNRSGVVCCLRNDKECGIGKGIREDIISSLKQNFGNLTITDTTNVAKADCTQEKFVKTLNSFWDLIRSAEVVVTDRLHCMIFCVITGTPCVVLDNSNKKISNVYQQWLLDNDLISMQDTVDIDQIVFLCHEKRKYNYSTYSFYGLCSKFSELKKCCK